MITCVEMIYISLPENKEKLFLKNGVLHFVSYNNRFWSP